MLERTAPGGAWDDRLARAGREADFLQTSSWARIDEAANGARTEVVQAETIGGLVRSPAAGGGDLSCLHGPVLTDPGDLEQLADFVRAVERVARERGCTSLSFIGRPVLSAVDPAALETNLARHQLAATHWLTSVVDLTAADDELLARADRSVTKALRRCEREGVSVRACVDAGSYEGLFLRSFAESRPDYDPERGRRAFALDESRHYRYWVAVDANDEVLATLGTYRYAGVATEIMSVRTARGKACGAPAQDLLHWHAMREHRTLGDAWFDLAGYAPSPATRAEEGIKRFKKKWGGREVATPTFAKPIGRRARRAARRIRARFG